MKCQAEFEYIVQIVNDHIANLQPSSKIVVSRQAQQCVQAIAGALEEDTPAVPQPMPGQRAPDAPVAPAAAPAASAPAVAIPASS